MTLIDDNKKLWIALNLVPGVGKSTYMKLIQRFGGPEGVFLARRNELTEVPGLAGKSLEEIIGFKMRDRLDEEIRLIEEKGAHIVTIEDPAYPRHLKHIHDPPPLLYVEGELKDEDAVSISMVGSRKPTWYGKEITNRLGEGLAQRGVTVVSGMARGIDSLAHAAALKAGGRTIAVLGCGLNVIYPPENKRLKGEIAKGGAVVSEFVMRAKPDRMNFPIRNRIISGISLGTVVVEASARSGALITARSALEQNREVFAVPGSVSSEKSRGTHNLIKEGAKLVESVEDIIEELPGGLSELLGAPVVKKVAESPPPSLSEEEGRIFSLLHHEAQHIDILTEKSGIPASKVAGVLFNLELEGLIKQLPGMTFIRIR